MRFRMVFGALALAALSACSGGMDASSGTAGFLADPGPAQVSREAMEEVLLRSVSLSL